MLSSSRANVRFVSGEANQKARITSSDNSSQRFGGAEDPIPHRRPLGKIGRHLEVDGAELLRVEQAQSRVEISRVGLGIESEFDDRGIGHVERISLARVESKRGSRGSIV